MCTISFIAKIPLQFQIKPDLDGRRGGGRRPLNPPQCRLGSAGDLGGPQTPCLTRNETVVTALMMTFSLHLRDKL